MTAGRSSAIRVLKFKSFVKRSNGTYAVEIWETKNNKGNETQIPKSLYDLVMKQKDALTQKGPEIESKTEIKANSNNKKFSKGQ